MNLQSGTNSLRPPARLRLVSRDGDEVIDHRREVARENHASRVVGPQDARWLLAERVQRSMEGGRAAVLRPEARRRLVAGAVREGLRPFDANLVIAIVQDAAQRGEAIEATPSARLSLVPPPERAAIAPLVLLGAAVMLGVGLLLSALAWLGV